MAGSTYAWRVETWAVATDELREAFEGLGFEVHVNSNAKELTIINRGRGEHGDYALTIAPISRGRDGLSVGNDALA
jgi:hypothetical protein